MIMQLHLQSFGTKLRVREGLFEVLSFGKDDQLIKEQFPAHKVDSIWMQMQTSVSSDAIMLATENKDYLDMIADRYDYMSGAAIIANEYFATDGLCTHENVHLEDGLVIDDVIECPKHNGRFNYKTGEALAAPVCVDLKTYPVKVEAGSVFIDLASLS